MNNNNDDIVNNADKISVIRIYLSFRTIPIHQLFPYVECNAIEQVNK